MELLGLGDDVLQVHVVSHVSYTTMARLSCTCKTMRDIARRLARQPMVRTHVQVGSQGRKNLDERHDDELGIHELNYLLGKLSVDTNEIVAEAGSDDNLIAMLKERFEAELETCMGGDGATHASLVNAMQDVADARAMLDALWMPLKPDLCTIFCSEHTAGAAEVLAGLLPTSCVILGAVSDRGVIGSTAKRVREVDDDTTPILSVSLLHLPATKLHPFFQPHTDPHASPHPILGDAPAAVLPTASAHAAAAATALVVADDGDSLRRGTQVVEALRGKEVPLMGGLVVERRRGAGSLLLRAPHHALRSGLRREKGAIGLVLVGGHTSVPAVTRGAAPVGDTEWVVVETDSSKRSVCPGHQEQMHVIKKLRPIDAGPDRSCTPLQALHDLSAALYDGHLPSPLYLALRPNTEERRMRLLHPRRVLPGTGALEVDLEVKPGELCRFASVNAEGSAAELRACAEDALTQLDRDDPTFCVSFVCCGRGERFHAEADSELRPLRHAVPEMPVTGFFAAGEFGPRPFGEVGSDRVHEPSLMGFTAVHAVLQFHGLPPDGAQDA